MNRTTSPHLLSVRAVLAILLGLLLLASGTYLAVERPWSSDSAAAKCETPKSVGQKCSEVTRSSDKIVTRRYVAIEDSADHKPFYVKNGVRVDLLEATPTIDELCNAVAIVSASNRPDYSFRHIKNGLKKNYCEPAKNARDGLFCFDYLGQLFDAAHAKQEDLPDFTQGKLGKLCNFTVDPSMVNKHMGN